MCAGVSSANLNSKNLFKQTVLISTAKDCLIFLSIFPISEYVVAYASQNVLAVSVLENLTLS